MIIIICNETDTKAQNIIPRENYICGVCGEDIDLKKDHLIVIEDGEFMYVHPEHLKENKKNQSY
ncbi:MAG TPA: hypothetical protein PK595_06830 [Bacteroidota bacterium]|nr:hypothetical protein [Bacteroidota bacterium]